MVLCGNLILSEVVLIFYSKIIKAGEILRQVKFHRLFHFRDGFCPNLFLFFLFTLKLDDYTLDKFRMKI